jgi:hypothetical protein
MFLLICLGEDTDDLIYSTILVDHFSYLIIHPQRNVALSLFHMGNSESEHVVSLDEGSCETITRSSLSLVAPLVISFVFVSHLHPAARQFCRSTYTITDITIK